MPRRGLQDLATLSRIGDESTGAARAQVRGDRLDAIELVDHVPRQVQIHRRAYQRIRHRVVPALDLNVVTEVRLRPSRALVTLGRRRYERRSAEIEVVAAPRSLVNAGVILTHLPA